MTDLREIFTDIYLRRGRLVPQEVVDEAADPAHPLHNSLEWNDAVAGNAYRCEQVARKIRSVSVKYAEPTAHEPARTVRAWVAAEQVNSDTKGYLPVEDVMADPFTERILLRELEREITALQRKYGHLSEFAAVVQRRLGNGETG